MTALSQVKNHWPVHFNKSLYDMPDDELPEVLDGSQLIAVVDFPKEVWWAASALHQLKSNVHLQPEMSGKWYVSGMGQKLVFVPDHSAAADGKIWESGKSYQIVSDQTVRLRSQRHWISFDPFTLSFSVPNCLMRISHQVQPFSRAPLRYQVVFNIESNFPLSLERVKKGASLARSLHSVPSMTSFQAQAPLENAESLTLQLKSDPIEPLAVDELLASLPSGDYMSGVICSSPAISDRVPASELRSELKLTGASVSLEKVGNDFWPQYILHLDFNQPVAINDVKAHLHLNSPAALQIESRAGGTDPFSRSHSLYIKATEYDPMPIAIEFTEGAWSETGIQPGNGLRWSEPLQLPALDSLCTESLKPIFQFDNSKGLTAAQVLACGDPDANPYIAYDLQVWKFINKKESPAIRVVGNMDGSIISSVICFDKSRDKIAIAQADDQEVASIPMPTSGATVKPFANLKARTGFVCDRIKSDCFAQMINLNEFCDAPVSDHP